MGVYSFFEDKWYSTLEIVDKVIPITKLTDRIDDHFPSFILFLIIIFLLLAGFIFLTGLGFGFNPTYEAEITVLSKIGLPLQGVKVSLTGDCADESKTTQGITNSEGKVNLEVCSKTQNISLEKTGYQSYYQDIDIEVDTVFRLSAVTLKNKTITVLVKDEEDTIVSGAELTLVCDGETTLFSDQTQNGFTVTPENSCELIQFRASADGFKEKTVTLSDNEERKIIVLEKELLEGTVAFETKTPTKEEPFVEIRITNSKNKSFTEITDGSGTKTTTLEAGEYKYSAFSQKGEVRTGNFFVTANSQEEVEIIFTDIIVVSKKAIYVRVVDNLNNPITGAVVSTYKDGNSFSQRSTNSKGETTPITIDPDSLPIGTTFFAVIRASGYETKLTPIEIVDKEGEPQIITINQGGAKLNVKVIDDVGKKVSDAFVTLYYSDFGGVFDSGTSDRNGEVLLQNLPAGNYSVKGIYTRTDSEGEETISIAQNGSAEVTLTLITGSGRMVFNFINHIGNDIDSNYLLYESIDGMLQKTVSGESTRSRFTTSSIKSRTRVKLATTNIDYFPHDTMTYKMTRNTQTKKVFLRELNSLPNTNEVQMFLTGVYSNNPVTSSFQNASRITSGETYYLYFDLILNSEVKDYVVGNFVIGNGNLQNSSISIENTYSIDGYTRVMVKESSGFFINLQGNNLVDENAKQANVILQEQQGKKSIPIILEIKVDENALAEEKVNLYFETRHGTKNSLLYIKEITIGESICLFEYNNDCPAFLLSHYIKQNEKEYIPLQENHLVLIGDDYTIKTTVKNNTDEAIGTAQLKLEVPKEKMSYLTIGNDTNSVAHNIILNPFESTAGNETKVNLKKKTNSGKIKLSIEKDESGINTLDDYELNEDTISLKIVDKEELVIEVNPEQIYDNSIYPFFYIKTKYKSQYKGVSALWYVKKNGVRLGSGYEGRTDGNGIQITSFDATNFDIGDVLKFVAEDINGNTPGSIEITVQRKIPTPAPVEPECIRLRFSSGAYADEQNIPYITIDENSSDHIIISSECTETKKVYLYTDLYVSEKNFDIAAGIEKNITVTGTIKNGIYGAYPLQVLEINNTDYKEVEHIDVVVESMGCLKFEDEIMDFRNTDEVETKITNSCFSGRKDIYNPQASISTNSVSMNYNKQGVPEVVNITAHVVGTIVESAITGFGWAEQLGATKCGEGCTPSATTSRPSELKFTDEASILCTNKIEAISTLEVTIRNEPEIDATDPTKPFYNLPTEIQNQITSQIANQSGNISDIIEEPISTASEENEQVKRLSFDGVTWRSTGWNTADYTAWTPGNLGHVATSTQLDDMEFVYGNSSETPSMEGSQSCHDIIQTMSWVAAPRPSNWGNGCTYSEDGCWVGGGEKGVAKIKPIQIGDHCNACSIGNVELEEEDELKILFLLNVRGETVPCGFFGSRNCDECATLKIQPELYRILNWQAEKNVLWEEDFNIVPIEGKVYTLGGYSADPVPEWSDLTVNSMFDVSSGDTWRSGMNGATLNTAICAQGMGAIPLDKTSGDEGGFPYKDEADPWVEYSPDGYTMYELVDVPSNVRMFLKNGDVYAEYIGTNQVSSPNIDMTFTNKSLQGEEYALVTVQDWVGDVKETKTFQVKLVGNPTNCYASDGTPGVTGNLYSPRLLFNWDWNNISYDQCDSENSDYTYCDGVQFNISIMKRLYEIEQLLLQGNLNQIAEKTAFYAYLIKDNYNQELLGDFSDYYSNTFLNAGTTFGKFKKFIDDEKLNYLVSTGTDPGTLLSYGGLYRVEIDVNRNNENLFSMFEGSNLNADIKITLRPVQKAPNYNPFYETPFDGGIGNNRIGYGASIDVNGLQLNGTTIADDKGNSAMKNVSFETSSNPTILNKEIVLEYDNNQGILKFYPAQPTPVEATITADAGTVNVIYSLEGDGASLVPPKEWNIRSSTIGTSKCHDFEDQDKTFFTDIVNETTHTLQWNGTKAGTIGITTTFFTPKIMSQTLRINSIQNTLTLNSYAGLINSETIFLNNYYLQGITNYDTLAGVFDMLDDEKVCMSKQSDSDIKLFWNPDYINEIENAVTTGSGSSCS